MATITVTPTDKIGIYNNVIYTYTHTISSNSNAMAIEVEIYINSVLQNRLFINAFNLDVSGSNFNYTFSINIKDALIDYFQNKAVFKPNIAAFVASEDEFLARNTQIKVFRYEPDLSGVLTKNATSTNSSMRTFFNSRVQDMSDYVATLGRKFLTSQVNPTFYQGMSKTLAIYADSHLHALKITKDEGDVVYETLAVNEINIIDISEYTDSVNNSLSVQGGTLAGETFTASGETLIYKIENACNFAVLHYQNRFGQMDSFVFERYVKRLKIDNETFSNNEYLNEILNVQNEYQYNLIYEGFTAAEFEYFKDVFASSVFYIEIDNVFKQVVIKPKSNISIIEENGMIDIELEFIESEESITFIN